MMSLSAFLPRRRAAAALAAGLLLAVGGCRTETVKPEPGEAGYYPLAVGAYWVYEVEVARWANNVPTVTRSQRRERVVESYQDATGQLTYRLVRSQRPTAADAWQDDSVLTVTVLPTGVAVSRNNRRILELVYPVKEGAEWNKNAYNDRDTIVAKNRYYRAVGQPATVAGQTYPRTVTTVDPSPDTLFYRRSQRQIFAQGVGPIYREKRVLNYCQGIEVPACAVGTNYVIVGEELRERLIEKGQ
ncbi:hypothetical protein [Hymenobacter sp. B81]|uniref:hypothetical protein n=1 Tax=Hymenobacter sp. B81 TaxID=3344878 RepID=UPI0037DD084B